MPDFFRQSQRALAPHSESSLLVDGECCQSRTGAAECGHMAALMATRQSMLYHTAHATHVMSRGAEHIGGRLVNERQPASPKSCSGDSALTDAVGCSKMLECSLFARRKRWMSRESPESFGSAKIVADVSPESPKMIASVSARFGDMS